MSLVSLKRAAAEYGISAARLRQKVEQGVIAADSTSSPGRTYIARKDLDAAYGRTVSLSKEDVRGIIREELRSFFGGLR